MVAKSFQSMTQMCEPFVEKGRMYVNVKNEKTGTVRKVRWYTDTEYAKMYGEKVNDNPLAHIKQQQVLGFQNGYVTIFKGNTYANLEWFQKSIARYCKLWGWYIVSTETVPFDLPCGLEPVKLQWELVGEESGCLKPDHEVKAAVESILYDKGNSTFQGTVGEKLTLELEVISAHKRDSYYGEQTVHYMVDPSGNQYLWATAAKSWSVGDKYHIRGTVKEHKIIRNVETTILTRCTLVK